MGLLLLILLCVLIFGAGVVAKVITLGTGSVLVGILVIALVIYLFTRE